MRISCDKIFLLLSRYLSLWPWLSLELVIIWGICISQTHLVENWMVLICKTSSPLHPRCFLPILSKLAQWFRRRFVNWVNVIPLLFSIEKGRGYSFEQSEFLLHKDALCQVWLKLTQWFWRRWKMWKVFRQTDESTDNRRSEKLTWTFSSGKLKTSLPKTNMSQARLKMAHLFWRIKMRKVHREKDGRYKENSFELLAQVK